MTAMERLEMYAMKKVFVGVLSAVLTDPEFKLGVTDVRYEAYKKTDDNREYFAEYVVVTYKGGAESVRCVTGNSNLANYQEIGKLLEGGYYDEMLRYNALTEEGFVKVV